MNYFRIILFTFFLTIFCANSSADFCSIKIPLSPSKKPIFQRHYGSLKLKIPNSKSNSITLREDERVTGYCATGFKQLKYQEYVNRNSYREQLHEYTIQDAYTAVFECSMEKISFTSGDISKVLIGQFVECKDLKWHVYEVEKPFNWCSSKATSYLLGSDIHNDKIKMAGVCFNLQNMLVESIRYTITANNDVTQNNLNSNIPHPEELESSVLGVEVENFLSIMQMDSVDQAVDLDGLLQAAVYTLDLISQNRVYGDFLHEYGDFLKVSWWHNLLYGNWKRFTTALIKQAALTTYDAITGISGGIKEPQFHTCCHNEIREALSPKFIQHSESLPAYIWTYLKGRNTSEDFVVIGYNSPFFQFFDSKEIVFCKDICGDIPWLKDVSSTFSYSALGVVFCCTPEDVRNSQILNGFPNEYKNTLSSMTVETIFETELASEEETSLPETTTITETIYDEEG